MYKFEAIAERLRRDLDAKTYIDRLPSERHLARQLKTTPVTLRKAQALLVAEGRLVKRPPLGTFVATPARPKIRVSLLLPLFTPGVMSEIGGRFREAFPEADIEFLTRGGPMTPRVDCDLVGIPGVSPVACADLGVPFDGGVLERLPLAHYFEQAFRVHQVEDRYYGLPVLFSPMVLLGDRAVLEAGGFDTAPYSLDAAALAAMADEARRRGMALWDGETVFRVMRSLVFAAAGESDALWRVNEASLRAAWAQWAPLFARDLVVPGDHLLSEDRMLLRWSCRQALAHYDPARTVLYAWPRGLRAATGVAGEFLLLNRNSPHRALAARVALHFLDPAIQAVLGRNGIGLPVLKGAAVDCLGTRPWRDDIFLAEVRHICANSAREHEFLHRLTHLARALVDGGLGADQALRQIEAEIDFARQRHALRQAFLTRCEEPAGEASLAFG